MTNNTFSIKRFKHQFLLDFNKELAQALLLIGLSLGLNVLFILLRITFIDRPEVIENDFEAIFIFSYVPCSLFFSGSLFFGLRNKSAAISYLTIPTSVVEKYFSYLLLVIIYNACFLLLYQLVFEAGIIHLIEKYNDKIFIIHLNSDQVPLWVAAIFILLHPFFLFGSVSFKKLPAIKTIICLGVFFALLLGLLGLYNTNCSWLSLPLHRFFEYRFFNIVMISSIVASLLFLILTFLRLKEKEV